MGLDDRMRDAMRELPADAGDANGAPPDELRSRARRRVRARNGTRLGAAAMALVLVAGAIAITRDDHRARQEHHDLASGLHGAGGPVVHLRTGRTTGPFAIALSNGQPAAAVVDAIAVARGNQLSAAEIAAIEHRLPKFDTSDASTPFERPPESLPRPRVGTTVSKPFGGAPKPPPAPTDDGPLRVLRYQPVGVVDVAPDLSVTFSQPMVRLATLADLADASVPVRVTPAMPGRWRWIGVRTLRFEYQGTVDRLPMATTYSVTIPAGTKSQTGHTLATAVHWTFQTPPPSVLTFAPENTTVDTAQVFIATFDQRVTPAAALASTRVVAGDKPVAIRLATSAEITADDAVAQIEKDAQPGRWFAFRPVAPLPKGTALTISIGPHTPSAEGPRVTATASTHTATTYSALAVTGSTCGALGEGCQPGSQFQVTFSNALDATAFDSSTITITPVVSAAIGVSDTTVTISAATKANTRYTVRFPATLRDQFGQTLGAPHTETFNVGAAQPALTPFAQQLVTTDPAAAHPTVSVTSVGHATLNVDVYAVNPTMWLQYQDFLTHWYDLQHTTRPPFPQLSHTTITVPGGGAQMTESTIDLRADLHGATGDVVVVVSPTRQFPSNTELYWRNRPTIAWVQETSIAVDAFAQQNDLIAWATDLRNGAPIAGVTVRLGGTANSATTGADGVARVPLATARYLTATKGNDVAILPADAEYQWAPQPTSDAVTGFVFDTSGIYRPGNTVNVKGWFRRVHAASGALAPLTGTRAALWTAYDAFGTELGHGNVDLNAHSGFALQVSIPPGAALGSAHVDLITNDGGVIGTLSVSFQIQEFRRPEFEVVTRTESAGPYVLTAPVTLAATGQYFSGGVLANSPVVWQVTYSQATYTPPNWSDFGFGVVQPYWFDDVLRSGAFAANGAISRPSVLDGGRAIGIGPCCPPQPQQKAVTYKGVTDANGTHYLQLDFNGETPDLPITVSANASVTDVNRQSFASNIDVLVHPSTLYVGIRSARQFVREGEPIVVDAIVTDINGKPVVGRAVAVTVARVDNEFVNGQEKETDVDPKHCSVTSSSKPESCSVIAGISGQYKITAIVKDDAGGRNRSEITRWVSGADTVPSRTVEQETATVIPDHDLYHPGDTAQLLVMAPFANAEGLMTIAANNTTTTQRFTVRDGSALVPVAIPKTATRGVEVQVDLAGSAPRLLDDGRGDPKLPPRPAFATGALALHVDPVAQRLTVSAGARQPVTEPGTDSTVDVSVKGADGAPVAGADVAVAVVDEAVLSVTGYKVADPVATIYTDQTTVSSADYLRSSLLLANPAVFGVPGSSATTPTTIVANGAGGFAQRRLDAGAAGVALAPYDSENKSVHSTAGVASAQPTVRVRTNFNSLALFSPSLVTDASGTAHATFKLPDSLTRYRVMVVAADGTDRFGAGESTITARIPLQVRPSPPRFANFGDRFELPVVVQNQTDVALDADVVVDANNLALTDGAGRRVHVAANSRVEVRFPVATVAAGSARYRVSASDGTHLDSAAGAFPVYTPVTTEAFATYGVVDNGVIAQPLQTPTGVVPQYGGLEIDTSSTAMQSLTDAVVYLEDYPYESVDAFASRVIALTSLRGVFAAFGGANVPTPAQVDARIRADVQRIEALQRADGGFGMWDQTGDPDPYVSVEATEALVLARRAGFAVSSSSYDRALAYVRDVESKFPSYWGQQERHAVSAYALHVRGEAGDRDSTKAEALYRSDPALTLDSLAWLWPVVRDPSIDAAIARTIQNRAHDTPAGVTFTDGYDDGAYLVLASDRRTDGIVLDALITKQPTSDLIPKVVQGLIGNQVAQGHWDNVQENGFILVALQRYFATYESQTPDFVARVWLGDTFAAEHSYHGRSTDFEHTLVPMRDLTGNPDIVLQKAGAGRLYYRLGLTYAPSDFKVPALDEGFVVDRVYEAVNDPSDVRRDSAGVWHIKPGAMVRVKLTMVADSNHTNMALVDSIPAGLEAVNPALAASPRPPAAAQPTNDTLPEWYGATWFDHENLRDDRAEAYSSYLYSGTYEYSYIARATTLGDFVVPPAKAEEIYAPEVFGRTASDRVIVG
jgi:uncharacterized protein YfaS (alpha-2-macroglobulin family)